MTEGYLGAVIILPYRVVDVPVLLSHCSHFDQFSRCLLTSHLPLPFDQLLVIQRSYKRGMEKIMLLPFPKHPPKAIPDNITPIFCTSSLTLTVS